MTANVLRSLQLLFRTLTGGGFPITDANRMNDNLLILKIYFWLAQFVELSLGPVV